MPSKETPGCLHTFGRFIYAILVRRFLPLVPAILTFELFTRLSACPAPNGYINKLCIL